MERAVLEQHLAQAEEHVALGERHIMAQRRIVAQFERDDINAPQAAALLAAFEQSQVIHLPGRDRLLKELAGLP